MNWLHQRVCVWGGWFATAFCSQCNNEIRIICFCVCRQFALIIYEVDGHLPLSPRVPSRTTLFIVPPVFPFAQSSVVALTSEIFDIIKFWYQSITKGIPNRQVGQIYLGQECCVLRKNLGVLLVRQILSHVPPHYLLRPQRHSAFHLSLTLLLKHFCLWP